eukprot:124003-Chlamydomonas_euryale.AAC.19
MGLCAAHAATPSHPVARLHVTRRSLQHDAPAVLSPPPAPFYIAVSPSDGRWCFSTISGVMLCQFDILPGCSAAVAASATARPAAGLSPRWQCKRVWAYSLRQRWAPGTARFPGCAIAVSTCSVVCVPVAV